MRIVAHSAQSRCSCVCAFASRKLGKLRCHRSDIGSRVCWLPQYALRGYWPKGIMPNVIECALPHAPTIYQIQLPSHAALALLTQTILRGGQPPPAQLNAWLGALPTPRGFDLGRFAQSSANPVSPGRAARALPSTAQSMRAGIEWALCKKKNRVATHTHRSPAWFGSSGPCCANANLAVLVGHLLFSELVLCSASKSTMMSQGLLWGQQTILSIRKCPIVPSASG